MMNGAENASIGRAATAGSPPRSRSLSAARTASGTARGPPGHAEGRGRAGTGAQNRCRRGEAGLGRLRTASLGTFPRGQASEPQPHPLHPPGRQEGPEIRSPGPCFSAWPLRSKAQLPARIHPPTPLHFPGLAFGSPRSLALRGSRHHKQGLRGGSACPQRRQERTHTKQTRKRPSGRGEEPWVTQVAGPWSVSHFWS